MPWESGILALIIRLATVLIENIMTVVLTGVLEKTEGEKYS